MSQEPQELIAQLSDTLNQEKKLELDYHLVPEKLSQVTLEV